MSKAKTGISSMKTARAFFAKGCAPALFNVVNGAFDQPLREEELATAPLMGGIMQYGYQCGMIWGATLAAGAQAYRLHGAGPQAEAGAVAAAGRLVAAYRARNKEVNCRELTGTDRTSSSFQLTTYFLLKGGSVRCCHMGTRYAPRAFGEIDTALSDRSFEVPAAPVSCSAVLARKMGASDMHAVMAAGFAGGIGLSGGACGALGAAIWITGLNSLRDGASEVAFKAPRAVDAVERFLKAGGREFECCKIVGRKFESIGDHARHLCNGGCAKIIEALAAP